MPADLDLDKVFPQRAWLPLLAIDLELFLVVAGLPFAFKKLWTVVPPHLVASSMVSLIVEWSCLTWSLVNSLAGVKGLIRLLPEDFINIDIAQAGHQGLTHEQALDVHAPLLQAFSK